MTHAHRGNYCLAAVVRGGVTVACGRPACWPLSDRCYEHGATDVVTHVATTFHPVTPDTEPETMTTLDTFAARPKTLRPAPMPALAVTDTAHPYAADLVRLAYVVADATNDPLPDEARARFAAEYAHHVRAAMRTMLDHPFTGDDDFSGAQTLHTYTQPSPFSTTPQAPTRQLVAELTANALRLHGAADDYAEGENAYQAGATRQLAQALGRLAEDVVKAGAAVRVAEREAAERAARDAARAAFTFPESLPDDLDAELAAKLKGVRREARRARRAAETALTEAYNTFHSKMEEELHDLGNALAEAQEARDALVAWIDEQIAAGWAAGVAEPDEQHPLRVQRRQLMALVFDEPTINDSLPREADEAFEEQHDIDTWETGADRDDA